MTPSLLTHKIDINSRLQMDTKQKLALLESFYHQAKDAGMAVRYHCDGVLVVSCFEEEEGRQPDLEMPPENPT